MTESQRRFQPSRPNGVDGSQRTGAQSPIGGDPNQISPSGQTLSGAQTVIGGRYAIQARIGEGAHAITYRAHDTRLKRTVAIKVLRSHLSGDTELVSRFVREAELAASISHPNVVDVYDVGTDGDVSYIVMRLVPGSDLKHVIQEQGRLPVARATPLVQQVLRGLGAIHAAGIVHRDVKPQNILITPDGTAQVTDFGVAYAALSEGLTTQGMTVGTASYMAPEQARGEPVTQATDIYAVGVVFYEMLTGRVPFTGENPMAVMMAHLQSRPTPPSQAAPGVQIPPWVEQIILRAMAKDPAQRFPSSAAMATALAGGPAAPAVASRGDEATTVVGAAAVGQAVPIGGDRTIVRPSAGGYGQALPPQRPATPPWLAGQGGDGTPPPALAPAGSGGHRRGWLAALLTILFGLLAVGVVAAATEFGPFDRGGDDRSPGLAAATDQPTATATAGPTNEAPAATSTVMAAVTPTRTPTETVVPATETDPPATEMATATLPPATVTSPPTATVRPTTPPTATATATIPPATLSPTIAPVPGETPAVVEVDPTQPEDAGGPANGNGDPVNGSAARLLSASGQGGDSIVIAPSDWQGAYADLDTDLYGRDCVAIYGQGSGYEQASLTFTLEGVPTADLTLTITGLDDEYAAANPFTVAVNGQTLRSASGDVTFPNWDASTPPQFAQLTATLPAVAFVDGENTITITNGAPDGVVGEGPYLLLGEGTLELT